MIALSVVPKVPSCTVLQTGVQIPVVITVPEQAPAWQTSPVVQAWLSLHEVPSAAAGFEHFPLAGLQVPATWHWSEAVQVTGLLPVQVPLWHESTVVQALPS